MMRPVFALAVVGIVGFSGAALSQTHDSVSPLVPPGILELLFWECDYARPSVAGENSGSCGIVREAFVQRKFSNDFEAFSSWWKANKAAAHKAAADRLRIFGSPAPKKVASVR